MPLTAADRNATTRWNSTLVALAGAARSQLPAEPTFELAQSVTLPPAGAGWLHEVKLDGYRLAARIANSRVTLLTRGGNDWTERFPAIAQELAALPVTTALLDGEVVALDARGRSDFDALQAALAAEPTSVKLHYQVFDLLHLDGFDLTDVPLEDRKGLLARLLDAAQEGAASASPHRIRLTEPFTVSGRELFEHACRLQLEGVVSKRLGSPYRGGRSGAWLKARCRDSQDFVVGGFTQPRGSRVGLGALLLGEYDKTGRLSYVGKVGTGLDDQQLRDFKHKLRDLERPTPPFDDPVPSAAISAGVTWIEPRYVVEVELAGRTSAGRVRQASFKRLRDDKTPDEANAAANRPTTEPPARAERSAAAEAKASQAAKRRLAGDAEVAGVTLTNPDRVLYPEQGVTKRDLAEYYLAVSDAQLPWASGRPLAFVRCPEGRAKSCFYQKHPVSGFAADLPRLTLREESGEDDEYLYLNTTAQVVALVQEGVLEIHAWGSRVNDLERPDMLVFDLDPSPGVSFSFTKTTARTLRDLLAELGLTGFLRTTGGKGLHVVAPLIPDASWDAAKSFAKNVATRVASTDPERLTTSMSKKERAGKLFVDYLRNARGATAITNYSTRSRPGAPVAVPLRWDELSGLASSDAYHLKNVKRRLAALSSEPWADYGEARRSLPNLTEVQP